MVVAGAMAIAAAAWIGRDLSQLVAQPVVFGLAYLAFALAVAIRFGAIPFHVWAARLTDAVPEVALPLVTAWGPGGVRGRRPGLDRRVDRAAASSSWTRSGPSSSRIGIASIVLAAFAAWIQDDLEHVVGYSIVGDAGVVLLAFAALDPDAWAPARTWILVFVVARSAFAAWAASLRATFGTGRIAGPARLGASARRSSASRSGLIVVAGIGLPGLAAFDARGRPGATWPLDGAARGARPPRRRSRRSPTTAGCCRRSGLDGRRPRSPAPDGRGGPAADARPLDVNDVRGSAGTFWSRQPGPRSPALLTVVLAVGALVVAAGGLGGPEAAAGRRRPAREGPSESFEPAARTTPGRRSRSRSRRRAAEAPGGTRRSGPSRAPTD